MTSPLDPAQVLPVALDTPWFHYLCSQLPSGEWIRQSAHERDLEAAAQPPVINVTMTNPEGIPVPGHYRVDTGSHEVAWHDEPVPAVTETRPQMAVTHRALEDTAVDWLPGGRHAGELRPRTAVP